MNRNWFRNRPPLSLRALEAREVPATFVAGNLLVYRVGDGTTGLLDSGSAVFLDEYSPTGTLVQSVALPTTANGIQKPLIANGLDPSEGLLTRSEDGAFVLLAGYGRAFGGSGTLTGTAGSAVNRVVGRIDVTGSLDTSTGLADFADGNSPRSVASTNGTDLWLTGGTGGLRHATIGSTTSTSIAPPADLRQAAIFDGQLYTSSATGSVRVGTVGTGTPTSSGQTIVNLPNFPTTGSPNGYYFADLDANVGLDTLYVADDGSAAISKYSLIGGNWISNGTVGSDADDFRGLTGIVSGSSVTLIATRKGGSTGAGGGELVSLVDATGFNGTIGGSPTLRATAASNTAFRGVAFVPLAPNLAPVNTLPTSFSGAEDTPLPLSNLGVADADAASRDVRLTLSVPLGTIAIRADVFGGITPGQVQGNGTGTVALTASLAAINATFQFASGVVYQPALNANGNVVLTMTTNDLGNQGTGGPKIDSDTSTLSIAAVNDTPTTSGIIDRAVFEDSADVTIDLTAAFADVETADADLVYTIDFNSNPGLFTSAEIAETDLTFDLAPDENGSSSITVRVTDVGGEFITAGFAFNVTAVNDAPRLDSIGSLSVAEDAAERTVNLTGIAAGPANEFGQTIVVLATSDNPGLIPNPTIDYTSPDSTGTLRFTPAANAFGSATITVSVRDTAGALNGGADEFTQSFLVTVDPLADAPIISNATTDEDTQSTNGLVIVANLLDGATVTHFKITGVTNGSLFLADGATPIATGDFVTLAQGNAGLRFTPAANFNGSATVEVRASTSDTDLGLGGSPATATITVNPVNDAPIVDAANFTVNENAPNGTSIGFVSAFDIDGDSLAFAIESGNANGAFAIDAATGAITVANSAAIASSFTLVVSATDGVLTDSATVTIDLNSRPTTSGIVDQTLAEDSTGLNIDLGAGFADLETPDAGLTFTLEDNSNSALFASATITGTTLTVVPAPNANGSSNLTVRATDPLGLFVETTFQVTVTSVNDAPILDAVPTVALTAIPFKANDPAGDLVARLTVNATDIDAGTVLGIAITGYTQGLNGAWQYRLDGASTWSNVPLPSPTQAYLLPANTRVRFLPSARLQGFAFLTYKAWDQSSGQPAEVVDSTAGTAFSSATETAVLAVGKTTPRIDAAGNPLLTTITEDMTKPKGDAVSTLIGSLASDANPKTKLGLAITGLTGTSDGTWQFSTGGNKWLAFGTASETSALLLRPTDKLRFVPAADFFGQVTVTYRVWDQSAGAAGDRIEIGGVSASAFSLTSETAVLNVTPVNDAPVIDLTRARYLADIAGGATSASAIVSDLLSGTIDVDGPALGLAIVGATGKGRWMYRTGAGPFVELDTASAKHALLLGGLDAIQYVSVSSDLATATLSYRAWDRSTGSVGDRVAIRGTAFGSDVEVLTVAIDNASTPVINGPGMLTPILEDAKSPVGDTIGKILGSKFVDASATPLRKGIALASAPNANGKWQYALTSNKWVDVGTVSAANALLLPESARLRFVPNANFDGQVSIEYRAWDQATGQPGDRLALPAPGVLSVGTTIGTASLTVIGSNDSPVLDTSIGQVLAGIPIGGTSAERTVAGLATATDLDSAAIGIAVTSATGPGGWEFSPDGSSWTAVVAVSRRGALLLPMTYRVRFVGTTGIGTASLAYRAWDGFTGEAEDRIAPTGSAISAATEALTVAVGNMAPTLGIVAPTLLTILEDAKAPVGDRVSTIVGGLVTDPDVGSTAGMAITAADSANGRWQYSLVRNKWTALGVVTANSALLLPATASLRFIPNADFNGTATVTFKAWDQSSGQPGDRIDATTLGFNSLSATELTATINVTALNDAPVLDLSSAPSLPDLPMNPPDTDLGITVASLLGLASDVDGPSLGIAITKTSPKSGTWQFSTDGANWSEIGRVSAARPRQLSSTQRVRFRPAAGFAGQATCTFKAWDGSAVSLASKTATVSVGNLNPELLSL